MQYKIPVQIENEDPIFLWLWLRQLMILMIWWWISYTIFDKLRISLTPEIAAVPALFVFAIVLLIVLFKHSEMTFMPFLFAILRYNINARERIWDAWIDSFQPIDIWYTTNLQENDKWWNIDVNSKKDKIREIENKLEKI